MLHTVCVTGVFSYITKNELINLTFSIYKNNIENTQYTVCNN